MRFNYLIKVDPNANNNKFYQMTEENGELVVLYGRVGNMGNRVVYPLHQWDTKFREKLRKGYVDHTHLHTSTTMVNVDDEDSKPYKEIKNAGVKKLIDQLQLWASKVVANNYTVKSKDVTPQMVALAQNKIDDLVLLLKDKRVKRFNDELIELFTIIPRSMSQVSNYLATSPDDFQKIIEKEQSLLDVMSGQVRVGTLSSTKLDKSKTGDLTILEAHGLTIKPVTAKEKGEIIKHLGANANMYSDAWKVVNIKTQKAFDEFLTDNGKPKVKLFWHGSRNENWWSILRTGLTLRPTNAVISGKMFGYGLYFAPKAQKSLGYTSLNGSYWARGTANKAYMSLMAVAYGTPYQTSQYKNEYGYLDYLKLKALKADAISFHALAGVLRNEEIIVYKEEQCTIKYLVELTN